MSRVYVRLFRTRSDGVDCQCRRCACSIRDPSRRNIGSTGFQTTGGACCGKNKEVQGEGEHEGDSAVEAVTEPEAGVDLLELDYKAVIHKRIEPEIIPNGGGS